MGVLRLVTRLAVAIFPEAQLSQQACSEVLGTLAFTTVQGREDMHVRSAASIDIGGVVHHHARRLQPRIVCGAGISWLRSGDAKARYGAA